MEIDKKRFKNLFPHLSEEMEQNQQRASISSVRSDARIGENAAAKRFDGYIPDVIDFIRRCDNLKQAEEIIEYMEKRNELNPTYARKLKRQLREKGVRSFGPKKQDDYYSREGII
jgi:hypothetical protein